MIKGFSPPLPTSPSFSHAMMVRSSVYPPPSAGGLADRGVGRSGRASIARPSASHPLGPPPPSRLLVCLMCCPSQKKITKQGGLSIHLLPPPPDGLGIQKRHVARLPLRRALARIAVRRGILGIDRGITIQRAGVRRVAEPRRSPARARSLQPELADAGLEGVLRQIDEQLGEAALGGGVVAEDGREGLVAEGLGETLSERFASARVIAESVWETWLVWKLETGE